MNSAPAGTSMNASGGIAVRVWKPKLLLLSVLVMVGLMFAIAVRATDDSGSPFAVTGEVGIIPIAENLPAMPELDDADVASALQLVASQAELADIFKASVPQATTATPWGSVLQYGYNLRVPVEGIETAPRIWRQAICKDAVMLDTTEVFSEVTELRITVDLKNQAVISWLPYTVQSAEPGTARRDEAATEAVFAARAIDVESGEVLAAYGAEILDPAVADEMFVDLCGPSRED
ncbi:MAG: hypothetical protein LC118_11165 [Dehalococcoidia bacterium]|nr:hypothetical protein [Dehalococcoidia bacterium]